MTIKKNSLIGICCLALFVQGCIVQKKQNSQIKFKHAFPSTVSFTCVDITGKSEFPINLVNIHMDEITYQLDTIQSCAKIRSDQFAQHQMPDSALAACGSWYAGAGDYFYCVRNGEEIVVYKGWQDAQQEDEGFHYQVFKRFVFVP